MRLDFQSPLFSFLLYFFPFFILRLSFLGHFSLFRTFYNGDYRTRSLSGICISFSTQSPPIILHFFSFRSSFGECYFLCLHIRYLPVSLNLVGSIPRPAHSDTPYSIESLSCSVTIIFNRYRLIAIIISIDYIRHLVYICTDTNKVHRKQQFNFAI